MTEPPEFRGCPELFIREDIREDLREDLRSLTASEAVYELMWVVSDLVNRINA